jgi:hypothetical protein
VAPAGSVAPPASMIFASLPKAGPGLPSLRRAGSSGLEKQGAAVSVRPMVSMMPMPNFCSKARCCAGGSGAEAERQKRIADASMPSVARSGR